MDQLIKELEAEFGISGLRLRVDSKATPDQIKESFRAVFRQISDPNFKSQPPHTGKTKRPLI